MLSIPTDQNSGKTVISKLTPYAFLSVSVLFVVWATFLLVCSIMDKLILLGLYALTIAISLAYFKSEIDAALKTKRAQMETTLAEIKDCQRGLLIEEKISTIAKFASVMAHELKNPLSSLKNISYYLIKTVKSEDPKGKRMMEMLASEVDRANLMIGDFSDIARAKRISKAPAGVSELIEQTLSDYKFDPEIELSKEIEPGIEANIDPDRTAQLLKNLLKNAKDAIGQGQKGTIKVSLKKTDKFFEITVSDTGTGMDKETSEHVFEPLFTTKNKSIGLGLTVVKETAEAHGGKVELET